MAANKPPGIKITGIRGPIPSGYLLGRTDAGTGDVQLVTMAKAQSSGLIPVTLPPSGAAGGDLSGSYPNPTVSRLQGNPISNAAPDTQDVLAWSGSAWAPLDLATVAYTGSYLDLSNLPPLTGGTAGQVLTKNSGTNYDFSWAAPAGGGAPGSAKDDGTNFYLATIDSAGQLILDAFGDPIFALEVLPPTAIPPLVGVTNGSMAAAGVVGEFISSNVARNATVNAPNTTTINITSISLTAGDWDVAWTASIVVTGGALSALEGGLSTISATLTTPPPSSGFTQIWNGNSSSGDIEFPMSGLARVSISTTTTLYLVGFANFSAGTAGGYGYLGARRVR